MALRRVWTEGMDNWYPLSKVRERFAWPAAAPGGGAAARNGSGVTAGAAGSDGWAPEHVALVERRVAALRTAWAQLGDDDLLDLLDKLP